MGNDKTLTPITIGVATLLLIVAFSLGCSSNGDADRININHGGTDSDSTSLPGTDPVVDSNSNSFPDSGSGNDSTPDTGPDTADDSGSGSSSDSSSDSVSDQNMDNDSDGWSVPHDCDDNDSLVFPGQEEDTDNQKDDDCDSEIDETPLSEDVDSFIWIANSSEGTVSKIDTRTLVEMGRYQVRPDGAGSPSRTSVHISGDMVVAARSGGVTKIYSDLERCSESNGTPGIQTSSGSTDILAWDQEECRAWHIPFSQYTNMRSLAWTSGELNAVTGKWENAKVWATGNTSTAGSVDAILINGDNGTVEATINIPDAPLQIGHGGYGGVVDSDSNFWIIQIYSNKLIKVDFVTHAYQMWDQPVHAYGISIDSAGRIWSCNRHVARFDPSSQTWETKLIEDWNGFYGHTGGCMTDGNGTLWNSINDKLYAIDTNTLDVTDTIVLPEGMQWGVAVDFDGYVWSIPRDGSLAYRVDTSDHSYQTVTGLVGAYTYSDMTGHSLRLVSPQ